MAKTDSARNDEVRYHEVSPDLVHPSDYNPRKHFDQAGINELADSIKQHGMLEPLVVRPNADGYEIVCGERRWRAAKQAGVENIPIRVLMGIDDRKALELALIENLCRKDIDPIEEAEGYRSLMEMGYKQTEIGEKVHRGQSTIANSIRLLELPEHVRELVSAGKLTPSHAKALLQWNDHQPVLEVQLKRALGGATTKDLEKITSAGAGVLTEAGVATTISRWDNAYKGKECESCNKWKELDYGKLCLDPDCAKRKEEKARDAALKAFCKKNNISAERILTPDVYIDPRERRELHDPRHLPAKCTSTACEFFFYHMDRSGDFFRPICCKPECFNALAAEEQKEESKEKRRRGSEMREKVFHAIDDPGRMAKLAAFAMVSNFSWGVDKATLEAAVNRLGIEGLDLALFSKQNYDRLPKIIELSKLEPEQIIRLVVELEARKQVLNAVVYGNSVDAAVEWLTVSEGPTLAQVLAPAPAPVKQVQNRPTSPCETCTADLDECELPADGECPNWKGVE